MINGLHVMLDVVYIRSVLCRITGRQCYRCVCVRVRACVHAYMYVCDILHHPIQVDSYVSLNEHAQQLDNWHGTYRYIEMDVVFVHTTVSLSAPHNDMRCMWSSVVCVCMVHIQDSNNTLDTVEMLVHQTVGGRLLP